MGKNNIIEIKNFTKYFNRTRAVDNLSFDVKSGDIFAFLGSNGSGKTTTIRALLGIYQADEGYLHVNGKPYEPRMASILGYLPEERGLYLESRVSETMEYFGQIKGLSKEEASKKTKQYLKRVAMEDKADAQIKTLSSGQQQKIQLGIATINEPSLLILDEPTKGLDPINRSLLMDRLKELNKNGSTIIFTTHQMHEVERIADSLIMIKEGKRMLYGNLDTVKRKYGSNTISIYYKGDFPENIKLYNSKIQKHYAYLTPKRGINTSEILKFLLSRNKLEIKKFEITEPSLEEIFIEVSNAKE